ncbi:MAG: hypothetical protein BAJATHORv1_50132 [Candidatus Thorarchaeota archaeon]|nr:MAG: hypothetical protein BAJATHORv1_50132 [Candidatus Thorarchaeota archaeon]
MPDQVRVLNFLPFDIFGSIQRRSLQVAKSIKKRSIETIFVLPMGSNDFSNIAQSEGFKVHKSKISRPVIPNNVRTLLILFRFLIFFFVDIYRAYSIIRKESPDVIHINGFVAIQEAVAASIYERQKTLWTLIGTAYPRFLVFLFSPLICLVGRRTFVSDKLRGFYFSYPSDPIIFEPLDPIFLRACHFEKYSKALYFRTNHDLKRPLFCTVGSINPAKGLEYLLEAFALFIATKEATLLIVGSVPDNQTSYYNKIVSLLERLGIQDHVHFTGFIPHKQIPSLLKEVDIFVMASVSEGTPVCIIEAMAMGLPIIATDVGGIGDLIINDYCGSLVPSKNYFALFESMISLWENKQKMDDYSKRARSHVLDKCDISNCIAGYEHIYRLITKCDA